MSLFKKNIELFAPTRGTIKKIEAVKDEVFSSRMLGDGFAVEPAVNKIFSPLKGEVISIFPSKHAISFCTKDKQEVLMHIGLDTVELNGQGFDICVKAGDVVNEKTVLANVDFDFIKSQGKETDILVVFPNSEKKLDITYGTVHEQEKIGQLR